MDNFDKFVKFLQNEFKLLSNRIDKLGEEVKNQKPPVVNVEPPVIEGNEVKVSIPEIKLPKIEIPEIKIPEIKVPQPIVNIPKQDAPTVNVPPANIKIEPKIDFPKEIAVKGMEELLRNTEEKEGNIFEQVSSKKPLSTIIIDGKGKQITDFGGDFAAPSIVGSKNKSSEQVNPATEEKQNDIITAINNSGGGTVVFKTNEIFESGTDTYFCKETNAGEWYTMKIDVDSLFTHATITNNPTIITYAQARADVLTLVYQIYNNAF